MTRILVAAAPDILEAVRHALPEMNVEAAPRLDTTALGDSDCLLIGHEAETFGKSWEPPVAAAPVVHLLHHAQDAPTPLEDSGIPSAHVENQRELRLAVRTAILQHRVETLLASLTGPWAHDARGALGVARLGIELLRAGSDPTNATQKVENGIMRLGWLMERLPPQVALALDLPLAAHVAPSLFPSLESYVIHLRLTHSRRIIDLSGGDWLGGAASQTLVPFAAGFAELAFKLSSPRTTLKFSAEDERHLEVECECPERPRPWDVRETVDALDLSRRQEHLPYRLLEAARLALRAGISLSVEFTEHAFFGRVQLAAPAVAS